MRRTIVIALSLVALWALGSRPARQQAATVPFPCQVLPADNIWNTPVDTLPLDPQSAVYIGTIGPTGTLVTDFGSGLYQGAPIGIPYDTVPGTQPKVPMVFLYDQESDPGPYPIPPNASIEGTAASDGDRHVLVVDRDNCKLYEVYSAYPQSNGSWKGGSGAIYDLKSNALRPDGWTSADAAGLPVLPGLMRYDEVAAGAINHAIRFTVQQSQKKYIWPARHYASSLTDAKYPPMGQRFRLKASFDISGFSAQNQVILKALKKYGMILADNGSNWFISGVPDEGWNNDDLHILRVQVHGSDFEAVDTSSLMLNPDSGQVRGPVTVVNAASYVAGAGAVAPGEIVAIFNYPGPAQLVGAQLNTAGLVDSILGGTRALFDGVAAPLVYAKANQLSAIVPYSVAGQVRTQLQMEYQGVKSAPVSIPVVDSIPGIFAANASGQGSAVVQNADLTLNSVTNAAARGSTIAFYATGEGQTDPAGSDGKLALTAPFPSPKLAVRVTIGGQAATVVYKGAVPTQVAGLMQVNVVVPSTAPVGGAIPLVLTVGSASSQAGITVAVK